jgi:hypothetical protein
VLELNDIALLFVFFGAAYWLWRGYAVKETVLKAARAHCQALEVQLLDESVVLRGLWLKRDIHNSLRVRRSYTFEFTSTGDDRYHGCIVVLGAAIETIQLAPHRLN